MVIAGIYNFFLLLPKPYIPYSLCSQADTSAYYGSLPGRVTQTFLPKGSGPLAVVLWFSLTCELNCGFH